MTEMAAVWDRIYEIWTKDARKEGFMKGFEKGVKIGIEEGKKLAEKRIKKREDRRRKRALLKMMNDGILSLSKLSEYLELELEKILIFAKQKGFKIELK